MPLWGFAQVARGLSEALSSIKLTVQRQAAGLISKIIILYKKPIFYIVDLIVHLFYKYLKNLDLDELNR